MATTTRKKQTSWTEVAEQLAARMEPPRCTDTLIKARRKRSTRPETARELERITGLDRRMFLWPDEFGDPWEIILNGNGRAPFNKEKISVCQ